MSQEARVRLEKLRARVMALGMFGPAEGIELLDILLGSDEVGRRVRVENGDRQAAPETIRRKADDLLLIDAVGAAL